MFIINPVYPGDGIMVAKTLNFRISESLNVALQDLLLTQIITLKLNFALFSRELISLLGANIFASSL